MCLWTWNYHCLTPSSQDECSMLLLDLGTLQFQSHLKKEERLKKFLERKKKGMDAFLSPSLIQEMSEYQTHARGEEREVTLTSKDVFDDDDVELGIFYNEFSLHVMELQALMLHTNMDFAAVGICDFCINFSLNILSFHCLLEFFFHGNYLIIPLFKTPSRCHKCRQTTSPKTTVSSKDSICTSMWRYANSTVTSYPK